MFECIYMREREKEKNNELLFQTIRLQSHYQEKFKD